MKTKLIDRYGSASLRAELPLAPHVEIANLARRSCSILHLRDRWKFVGKALLLALVAFALLFAGVLTHNDILVVCAFLAFAAAFALAFRLSPTRLEAQVGQTEGDIEKAVSAFDAECQNAARSFAATAVMAAKDEAQGLVRDGASFAALGEWREATRDGFHNLESDSAATLSACQEAVNNCRTDLQRQRKCLAGAGRGLKAQFIPGAARRAARDAIGAAVRLGEARIEEAMTKAQVHAYHSIAECVRNISCGDSVEMTTATGPALESPPVWLGTSLPPTEELEAEAERLVADNITAIRAKLIESEDKDALTTEVKQLLTNSSPGPHSVEEYVAGLNGDGAEWAERVLREATPFAPVSPIAGKPRFRKLLAMTSHGSDSAVFRNIREALSDQALHIVARDHPQSDVLCLEDEWGLCAGEFPEVAELIKEFRSLPPEEQALLCTACDASELRNFFPELPEDHTRPTRLLASARVFDVIQRSGSEDYVFDERIIAKGYRGALEALTHDQALAAGVATRVESVVSGDGVSAALTKLVAAKSGPSAFVPKEYVKLFKAGVEEAAMELNRRAGVPA